MKRSLSVVVLIALIALGVQIPARGDSEDLPVVWGGVQGSEQGQFDRPYGLAVDQGDHVYVADSWNQRIQKFNSDGGFVAEWGEEGTGDGQFLLPVDLAVGADGSIYVTDSGCVDAQDPDTCTERVQKFDAEGQYVMQWGGRGSEPGQFRSPWGVAVDSTGSVYVADPGNNRVQKFTSEGVYLAHWAMPSADPPEPSRPFGVAVDSSDSVYVYVANAYNHSIQKFSSDGTFLAEWGSPDGKPHSEQGALSYPFNLAVDAEDHVFVADTFNHRIQKFASDGTYLTQWGIFGSEPGQFSFPTDVAIDSQGHVYVVEFATHRVQKFGRPYDFGGFLSPIANPPVVNQARAGSAVPVKFSLGGEQGLDIFAAGYPASQVIACETLEPIGSSPLEPITISTALSYDPVSDQYSLVWKTERAYAGACLRLIVRLRDGIDHLAYFDFR